MFTSHSSGRVVADTMNASTDRYVVSLTSKIHMVHILPNSFYSSQGRQTSFPDRNANLIERLQSSVKDLATLEVNEFNFFSVLKCADAMGRWRHSIFSTSPLVGKGLTQSLRQSRLHWRLHRYSRISLNRRQHSYPNRPLGNQRSKLLLHRWCLRRAHRRISLRPRRWLSSSGGVVWLYWRL